MAQLRVHRHLISAINRMSPTVYYPLYDRTSGTTVADDLVGSSNGNYGGSPVTGVRLNQLGLTGVKLSTASSQWMQGNNNVNIGGANCTVVAWFRPTAFAAGSPFINNIWGNDDGVGSHHLRITSGAIVYVVENTSGSSIVATGPALTLNVPYMAAGTWNSSTARLYLNGVERATASGTGSCDAATRVAAGSRSASYSRGFDGWIGHCVAWTRTLSPSEIQHLFLASRRVPPRFART